MLGFQGVRDLAHRPDDRARQEHREDDREHDPRQGHGKPHPVMQEIAEGERQGHLGHARVAQPRQRQDQHAGDRAADGVELLWANARASALDFYRAQGFEEHGDEFMSLELPHRVVVLRLLD